MGGIGVPDSNYSRMRHCWISLHHPGSVWALYTPLRPEKCVTAGSINSAPAREMRHCWISLFPPKWSGASSCVRNCVTAGSHYYYPSRLLRILLSVRYPYLRQPGFSSHDLLFLTTMMHHVHHDASKLQAHKQKVRWGIPPFQSETYDCIFKEF